MVLLTIVKCPVSIEPSTLSIFPPIKILPVHDMSPAVIVVMPYNELFTLIEELVWLEPTS